MSPDGNFSSKAKRDKIANDQFFGKRSTSGLSQGKNAGSLYDPPIVSAETEANINGSANLNGGKLGKKKKKKRGAKSQARA